MRVAVVAALLLVSESAFAGQLAVRTETSACEAVKARGIEVFHLGRRAHPFCDYGGFDSEFFIVGLHAGIPCPDHQASCVGLIGWYAVRKGTSHVIRWNVANEQPGDPL